jgi:hypothetical protein
MHRLSRAAVAGAALLLLSACAANSPHPGAQAGGWEIQVENERAVNLRIFMLEGGNETRVGGVNALSARAVRLGVGTPGTIQLVARPAAPGAPGTFHRSDPVQLQERARITWVIKGSPGASFPHLSTVRVLGCTDEAFC